MKYPLQWISATDPANAEMLLALEEKMYNYYKYRPQYYDDISDSEALWSDNAYLPYVKIIDAAKSASSILEIGCGRSSLLQHYPDLAPRYTGIDFSENLISENRLRFPGARFEMITDSTSYGLQEGKYDLVFSVFVIEHTVYPHTFLDECIKYVKPGGSVIILAPNYLDHNWMASQQTNASLQSGRDLLSAGDLISAARAFYYNKILIPAKCKAVKKKPGSFFINLNPMCFAIDDFRADVDATYVTSEREVAHYLQQRGFTILPRPGDEQKFIQQRRLLLISATKQK